MVWYRWKWWIFAWSHNPGGAASAHGYTWCSVLGSNLFVRRGKLPQRPEIGIYPRRLWLEDRYFEIDDACLRRHKADQHIPHAWIEELKHIERDLDELDNQQVRAFASDQSTETPK